MASIFEFNESFDNRLCMHSIVYTLYQIYSSSSQILRKQLSVSLEEGHL